tara:strand:- start:2711 stop:4198 length:1488 start_codon:yes stop_codon:yes gene_type:complete
MRIKQIKNIFEQDDSIKYAIATNLAKYGRPDSRPGDKKSKLTKGLEKKREKHVLDLKKSMDENQEAEKAIRDTLSKEGGAAGLKPLVKAVKKFGINKEELVKLLKKIAKVKKHRDGDYILTPISEDDSFPGEPPSKGYMEARKLIDKLRATTFRKFNDDELYDFRKTIATAFDMSLRERKVSDGGHSGGAPIDLDEDKSDFIKKAEKMAALIKQRDALIKKHSDAGEMFSDKVYDLDSQIQKIAKSEHLTEDIKDDLNKIANSLKSKFDHLRFSVDYNKYNPERSRINVYGKNSDLFYFGNELHGKKFGEYEVFHIDDDDRGEIVRIVKSDQIMRSSGPIFPENMEEKNNPSMGIVRKKLGKAPKAGKVASKKKMKLPTGLINYMNYTIGEGHGLDQGDVDKIKTLAKALKDGGDLSQDVGLRKDAIRILNFLIKSNIVQDKTKDLSKGKVDEKKKKKDDRCTRIAKRKYDTWPSAYASGAVVRCRKGEIWKNEK